MTTRRLPRIGDAVTVLYLAGPANGVIAAVTDDLHELDVVTDDGATVHFRLNESSARFVSTGAAEARLHFRRADDQL